jgi:hypothetical protein
MTNRSGFRQGFVLLAAVAVVGCDSSTAASDPDLATQVRLETQRFSSTAVAASAGYQMDEHCVAHPQLGGMGHHWVNGPLIDGTFEPMRPEVLLYERTPGGEFRLTGVEYVVLAQPGVDLEGPARPRFDNQPFDIGGVGPLMQAGVPHWSLHVWVHKDNPSGMFAPFNPSVSCAGASGGQHQH